MFINYIIVRVGISEWFTKRLSEFCYNQKTEQWSSTRSRGTAITAWYLVFENNHLMISSYALFLTILFLNANIFKWYKFSLSKRLFPLFLLGRFFLEILLLSVMPKLADLDPCLRDNVPAEHLNSGGWKGLPPAERLILLTSSSTLYSYSFTIIT